MSAFKDWLNGLTSKSTPVDSDVTYLRDSEDSGASKKLTLANLWLYIKGKADTVYSTFSGSYDDLADKPTLGSAAALDVGTTAGTVAAGDHSHSGYAANGAVTSSGLTMATARLLGRSTASTGAVEEISVGSGLSLSAGTLSASGGGGTPGGSGTELQYRSGASSFGAVTGSSVDGASLTLGGETVTTSKPVLDLTQTWDASGVTFVGESSNITDTASASASLVRRWQVNGTTVAALRKDGKLLLAEAFGSATGAGIAGLTATTTGMSIHDGGGNPGIHFYTSNVERARWTSGALVFARVNLALSGDCGNPTVGFSSVSSGEAEVNSGMAGTYRDLKLRNLTATGQVNLPQYTTATRPTFSAGALIYDSDLDKALIGGASAWEVVTSS